MSRVALCFNGLASGTNDKKDLVNWKKAVDSYKKNIINHGENEVDVFFHTWSTESEKEIAKVYESKDHIAEQQIDFSDIKEQYEKMGKHSSRCRYPEHFHSVMSRWRSHCGVLKLKNNYEQKHKFKYDYVMVTRFDQAWLTPVEFSQFDQQSLWCGRHHSQEPSKTINGFYDPKYRPEECQDPMSIWRSSSCPGIMELWLFGGSEIVDTTMDISEKIPEYIYNDGCLMSNHVLLPYHMFRKDLLDRIKFHFWEGKDFQMVRKLLREESEVRFAFYKDIGPGPDQWDPE